LKDRANGITSDFDIIYDRLAYRGAHAFNKGDRTRVLNSTPRNFSDGFCAAKQKSHKNLSGRIVYDNVIFLNGLSTGLRRLSYLLWGWRRRTDQHIVFHHIWCPGRRGWRLFYYC
jgi:hypothetical protein